MKNIINLVYVVLCTLVVSCSSFLDEKPQSDFMQEGTGTEDQESKYGSLALSLIHISEPTRLGMISYAVFCLKKKKKKRKRNL